MRIGEYDLRSIRSKILTDLYGTEQGKLDDRKIVIAQKNRELWLEKYKPLLDQLPEQMVTRHTDYHLAIKYTPGGEVALEETWDYKVKDPIINPCDDSSSSYRSASQSPLHPNLETETAVLCNEILQLKEERGKMEQYLVETTRMYKGSLQLRKVWDPSLHRYLPKEPVKTPKKSTQIKEDPASPTFLKKRMTINLLEDN